MERPLLASALYWIAIAMSVGCVALVLAGNTQFVWRYEHIGIPLSWVIGVCAVLAFLAFEYLETGSPAIPHPACLEFSTEPVMQEPELS